MFDKMVIGATATPLYSEAFAMQKVAGSSAAVARSIRVSEGL